MIMPIRRFAMLTVLSPFVPLFGSLLETLYQWERPFSVDDGAFRARFPGVGTSLPAAVRATADAMSAAADHARTAAASSPAAAPTSMPAARAT